MIKWNEVTWYSRIASILLFVGIMPVVNFFIGVQYEETQAALQSAEAAQNPPSITIVHKVKQDASSTTPPVDLQRDWNPVPAQQ